MPAAPFRRLWSLTWMLWNPPRPHGATYADEKEDPGEDDAAQTANVTKEKRMKNQSDQRIRGRPEARP